MERGKFLETTGGLGGVRRRIMDIWLEAEAGNTRSIQAYIDQREVRTLFYSPLLAVIFLFHTCDAS